MDSIYLGFWTQWWVDKLLIHFLFSYYNINNLPENTKKCITKIAHIFNIQFNRTEIIILKIYRAFWKHLKHTEKPQMLFVWQQHVILYICMYMWVGSKLRMRHVIESVYIEWVDLVRKIAVLYCRDSSC